MNFRLLSHSWSYSVYSSLAGRVLFIAPRSVKNLPATQETRVRSLGQEDPLEKGTATHSRILAWRTPRTEEPGLAAVHGVTRVRQDLATEPPLRLWLG